MSGIIERVNDFENFIDQYNSYSFLSHFPVIKENREISNVSCLHGELE